MSLVLTTPSFFIAEVVAGQQLQIVRDAQIESFINKLIDPIVSLHGYKSKDFKVILVYDKSINAFVTTGKQIFVHTGLIQSMPDAKALQAVLAHELAHLQAGHISRLKDNQASSLTTLLATALLAVPLGVLTKSLDVTTSVLFAGIESARLNIFRYSRNLESEADFLASKYLENIGVNPNAMVRGLLALQNETKFYTSTNLNHSTHPLIKYRIDSLKTVISEKYNNQDKDKNDSEMTFMKNDFYTSENNYDFIKGKLIGFTNPPERTIRLFEKDINLSKKFVKQLIAYSIALMRNYRFNEAIDTLNLLGKPWQKNPYTAELKADILFRSGKYVQALVYYEQAITLAPKAHLLIYSWLRNINAGAINITEKDVLKSIAPLLTNYKYVAFWKELAHYYNRIGNKVLRELYLAEVAFQLNRPKEAIVRLKPILKLFASKLNYQHAKDIIHQAEASINSR